MQRIDQEPDLKLRSAIRMMTAYVLHDRPRAFFPDSFLEWRRLMVLAKIRHKITGQLHIDRVSGALFEHLRYNRRALRWLHAFWRAPEIEGDLLVQALPRQRVTAGRTPPRSPAPPR